MEEALKQFILQVAEQMGAQTQEQIQQVAQMILVAHASANNITDQQEAIESASEMAQNNPEKLISEVSDYMQAAQQQEVAYAKWGAKLNYINYLRGNCPQGYEMRYFKKGGKLCKKCIAKQKAEQKKAEKVKGNTIDDFKKEHKGANKKVEKGKKGIDTDDNKELIEKFGPAIEDPEYRRYIMNGDAAGADSIAANKWNDQEIQTMYPGEYQGGQWTPDRNSEYYRNKNNRLRMYLMNRAIEKAIGGTGAAGAVGGAAAIKEKK